MPEAKGRGRPKASTKRKSKAAQHPAPTVFSDTVPAPRPEGYVTGRPTDYREEYCQQVIEWGKLGKSRTWMAAHLGIDRKTIDNWADRHPEFFLALSRAKALEQAFWEDVGFGGMQTQGFGQSIWSRNMAARFPDEWRERNETAVTGASGGPVLFQTVEFAVVEATD